LIPNVLVNDPHGRDGGAKTSLLTTKQVKVYSFFTAKTFMRLFKVLDPNNGVNQGSQKLCLSNSAKVTVE